MPTPLDVRQLDLAFARVLDRRARVIGWGSGSVFDYFQDHFPIRLDYLVDNDARRWGSSHRGIAIEPPTRLASEDPDSTVVIIYSGAWLEILADVSRLGPLMAVPASAVFADAHARARLRAVEDLAAMGPGPRRPSGEHAIVLQGPVLPGLTPLVVAATAAAHPEARVVLSTWRETDPALLAAASVSADEVVLSERPTWAGIQHRNYQIVSTQAGIARAIDAGAHTILKTRTDLAVLAEGVFDQAAWLGERFAGDTARAAGMQGRLIVPSSFTRKFLLYHPSDLIMLGAADDLRRYWDAPLDNRTGHLLEPDRMDQSLAAAALDGHPAESYLATAFCRSLGRPVRGTLGDSWAFYRDLFAVVDNDWFDAVWLKNLSIPDAAVRSGPRETVSHRFWLRLHMADPGLIRDLSHVNPDAIPLRALAGAAR